MVLSTPQKRRLQRYAAPALEKGLDILELLADQRDGLTIKAITQRLGRSTGEIYRMLASLERRGYLHRDPLAETYRLTPRLFELAHRHPPTRRLLDAALPAMHQCAEATGQSCQLGIRHEDRVLMLAQVDSPEPRGFSVRVGATFNLTDTASGLVLLAFGPDAWRDAAFKSLGESERTSTRRQLDAIAARGFHRARSRTIAGIVDMSFPLLDHRKQVVAALTMPYLVVRGRRDQIDTAQDQLGRAAQQIITAIGGCTP